MKKLNFLVCIYCTIYTQNFDRTIFVRTDEKCFDAELSLKLKDAGLGSFLPYHQFTIELRCFDDNSKELYDTKHHQYVTCEKIIELLRY
jgi:hypothetical protein